MAPVEAACVEQRMRLPCLLVVIALLSACGNRDVVAEEAVPPAVNELAEMPGDWSALASAVGRTPGDSALFVNSPVTVDLNAMLGPDAEAFRSAMVDAAPLAREGGVLVSASRAKRAYLLIDPAGHALEAGLRREGRWQRYRTAGTELDLPPSIRALVGES